MEGQHGRKARNLELVEGAARAFERILARRTGDDELGEQRVEGAADDIAGGDATVDANPRTTGEAQRVHRTGCRHEVQAGIFAVDAELERVTFGNGVVIVEGPTLGETELLAHEIDAGDLLGDGMLDLQPGVDLEEGDGAVTSDEELAGAGAEVTHLFQDRLRRGVEKRVLLVAEERRGGLFHELLVAALQRAVTRGDHHDLAVGIGQALGFDVPRLVEVLLHEALSAAEGGDRLARRRFEEFGNLLAGARHLEAAPSAAEGRLDRDRQAVRVDEIQDLGCTGDRVQGAGCEWRSDLLSDMPRGHLVAELLDGVGRWPDPDEPRIDHRPREGGVLGEEPVAGVHRIRSGTAGDRQHLVDAQVGVRARGPVEGVSLVCELHVPGIAILVGIDGDGCDPAVLRGPDDSYGDFASVSDQDLRDAGHSHLAYGAGSGRLWR